MARKGFSWRRWNNILHRDIGYLIIGMSIIYALSGIALNHMADWNPSYEITHSEVRWQQPPAGAPVSEEVVLDFLDKCGERDNYKMHFYPAPDQLKIFLKGGSILVNMTTGEGLMEQLRRRPVFFEVNFLHYNPKRVWTWFSDIFCGALIIVALTGMFVLRGRKGISGRGAWLTAIGVIIPLAFLITYL